jgi:glucosyl-3-phosphoglycerate synthase
MIGYDAPAAWEWFVRRTYHHSQFDDPRALLEAKRARGSVISVCLPTLNESETIVQTIRAIREPLVEEIPLIDELVVIDSDSRDDTVKLAKAEGATVYQDREILPELEPFGGKGDALWKSLFILEGDILAFIDTDIRNFHPRFAYSLFGPLLFEEGVHYVKGFYERPIQNGGELASTGGGRVTELLARPLLNLFFPALAAVVQPLSGEYAGTREILESVPFFTGYGVEFGLLVDILDRVGLDALAQVDMDVKVHRNQGVPELSRMAFGILQVAVNRLAALGRIELCTELSNVLYQFKSVDGTYEPEPWLIEVKERPPANTVPGYRSAGGTRAAGR